MGTYSKQIEHTNRELMEYEIDLKKLSEYSTVKEKDGDKEGKNVM